MPFPSLSIWNRSGTAPGKVWSDSSRDRNAAEIPAPWLPAPAPVPAPPSAPGHTERGCCPRPALLGISPSFTPREKQDPDPLQPGSLNIPQNQTVIPLRDTAHFRRGQPGLPGYRYTPPKITPHPPAGPQTCQTDPPQSYISAGTRWPGLPVPLPQILP